MVEARPADLCDNMSRDQIKQHLLDMADRHIHQRESYKSIQTDAKTDLNIWLGAEDGVHLTVCTMKADGLTVDDFKNFQAPEAFPANATILDKILTCRKLEVDVGEGCYCMY